jgi:hypothetical protein
MRENVRVDVSGPRRDRSRTFGGRRRPWVLPPVDPPPWRLASAREAREHAMLRSCPSACLP